MFCHTCKIFSNCDDDKEYYKVPDHYYYNGNYRNVVHNICNLRYKTPNKFLWYFTKILILPFYNQRVGGRIWRTV